MNEKTNIDINFPAIFDSILKKLWLIILVAVLCAGAAYVRVAFFVTPLYSSTATLYVGTNSGNPNNSDMLVSDSLAKDYEEIINRPVVLEDVINELGLDISASSLRGCISVVNVTDTRILDITVTTPDPVLSMNIANTICPVASEKFISIVQADYVNIVDTGSVSHTPSNINMPLSIILAVIAGVLVCLFCIVVRTLMDDKIKTPDDIERYLGLSVLGTVPFNKDIQNDSAKSHSSGERKRRQKKASA